MKRLLFSFIFIGSLQGSEISNILNNNYNELFDLELQKSLQDKKFDSKSWISPIMLSWDRGWSDQVSGDYDRSDTFSVSIDQPIFKSGGIYYGIKFAQAKYDLNTILIQKEKRALIVNAIELLFKIKQTKLNIAKLKLQLKNNKIEVNSDEELYNAGMIDGIELDTALAKEQQSQISLLNLEQTLQELKSAFAKISSKNPNRLRLPKLKLLNEEEFIAKNLDIKASNADLKVKKYASKLTATKYLPTVSVGARYSKISPASYGIRDSYRSYSLRVSMPLSVNVASDLERAKLDRMIAQIKVKNSKSDAKEDYNMVKRKLSIINRQIELAHKEASIYKKLLVTTKRLYKAGQRSKSDVDLLRNSYKMKNIDAQIYAINKELELLKLYAKMQN